MFLNILAEVPEASSETVSNDAIRGIPRSRRSKIEAASDRFVDLFKRVALEKPEGKN
jgi:hypothetical protein